MDATGVRGLPEAMNCKQARGHLLQAERPVQPGIEVQKHLAACRECRQWQRRLIELEQLVPELPSPPSSGKAELFALLALEPAPRTPGIEVARRSRPRLRRWFESPALGPVGLAASLLMFAFIWWVVKGTRDQGLVATPVPDKRAPAPDLLLANLMKRNVRLAKAQTERDRLEALTDLATDLHSETRTLASSAVGEDLVVLSQMYSKVVRDGVVKRAEFLSPKERTSVLNPLVSRLEQMEKQAEQLADEAPAASADTLRSMAAAARAGTQQLRSFMREEQR